MGRRAALLLLLACVCALLCSPLALAITSKGSIYRSQASAEIEADIASALDAESEEAALAVTPAPGLSVKGGPEFGHVSVTFAQPPNTPTRAEISSYSLSIRSGVAPFTTLSVTSLPAAVAGNAVSMGPNLEGVKKVCVRAVSQFGSSEEVCRTVTVPANPAAPAHHQLLELQQQLSALEQLSQLASSPDVNDAATPVNGNYSQWSDWSACNAVCGGGNQTRTRSCDSPAPAHGGDDCNLIGPAVERRACNTFTCNVDGGWGKWSTTWSNCSAQCDGGVQVLTRACDSPAPKFGGAACKGPHTKTRKCNTEPCLVHGGYSDWGKWEACSAQCGGGVQVRRRTCTNPTPRFGGYDCNKQKLGADVEVRPCNPKPCAVAGGYGPWSDWGKCSSDCDAGFQSRSRECDSPKPAFGGLDCSRLGLATETRPCNGTQVCALDGGFSEWTAWTACPATCGGGLQTRTRTCTNPAPRLGGKDCVGAFSESRACNTEECAVNGGYSEWSDFGSCSAKCGGGVKTRTRTCSEPLPAFGGKDCAALGASVEHVPCNTAPCGVDGDYSDWSAWSACSADCGGGLKARQRLCNSPSPSAGGRNCSHLGEPVETAPCNTQTCPVNGGFTDFGEWSTCTAQCGGGKQSRTRTCTNPTPAYGGADCSALGSTVETRDCNTKKCTVDGGFSQWSDWGSCSAACGGGTQSRSRTCTNPAPAFGGNDCSAIGQYTETRPCNSQSCAVNGAYSPWSDWSACSANCGGGSQTRSRTCSSPSPQFGGADCTSLGPAVETRSCNTDVCAAGVTQTLKPAVDGGFSSWSDWSECSATCGSGVQSRSRTCDNPAPAWGGNSCSGSYTETRACNTLSCSKNGGYSEWSEWGTCTSTCGGGFQYRSRSCTNPAPAGTGSDCSILGASIEGRACNTRPCAVDGGYGEWSAFGSCSAPCGGGIATRTRSCVNPAPANGGRDCARFGSEIETKVCNTQSCPLNGGFSEWTLWSACSAKCDGGIRTRTRACTNPAPSNGGAPCSGIDRQVEACNTNKCPRNGGWSSFSAWSPCSAKCGGGVQSRTRVCNNPEPAFGGMACVGEALETRTCNSARCSADGGWTKWSKWSKCSAKCGGGLRSRHRTCSAPAPQFGGAACVGPTVETQPCNSGPCVVNGGYSDYGPWSNCSSVCGGGKQTRTRTCSKPEPSFGGADCSLLGPATEQRVCNEQACPVDGGLSKWSKWSKCSAKCGGGVSQRTRSCTNPAPAFGGKNCDGLGETMETKMCNNFECKVDGGYGSWGKWSKCTAACGSGIRIRFRKCDSPKPAWGGKPCSGSKGREIAPCNTQACPTDGGYSKWGAWGKCSASCGGGVQVKERTCTNPAPAGGGMDCDGLGPSIQRRPCNTQRCKINAVCSNLCAPFYRKSGGKFEEGVAGGELPMPKALPSIKVTKEYLRALANKKLQQRKAKAQRKLLKKEKKSAREQRKKRAAKKNAQRAKKLKQKRKNKFAKNKKKKKTMLKRKPKKGDKKKKKAAKKSKKGKKVKKGKKAKKGKKSKKAKKAKKAKKGKKAKKAKKAKKSKAKKQVKKSKKKKATKKKAAKKPKSKSSKKKKKKALKQPKKKGGKKGKKKRSLPEVVMKYQPNKKSAKYYEKAGIDVTKAREADRLAEAAAKAKQLAEQKKKANAALNTKTALPVKVATHSSKSSTSSRRSAAKKKKQQKKGKKGKKGKRELPPVVYKYDPPHKTSKYYAESGLENTSDSAAAAATTSSSSSAPRFASASLNTQANVAATFNSYVAPSTL